MSAQLVESDLSEQDFDRMLDDSHEPLFDVYTDASAVRLTYMYPIALGQTLKAAYAWRSLLRSENWEVDVRAREQTP